MGADNWGICPKCKATRDQRIQEHEQQVIDAYGKIHVEEYMELRNYVFPELGCALREDYEIGITLEGEFYVIYKGQCYDCQFKYEYRYTEQAYP